MRGSGGDGLAGLEVMEEGISFWGKEEIVSFDWD